MKTFTGQYCAQGDLNIYACDEIPEGLTELKPENGVHILAHSETGHHHVIDGNTVRVFRQDEFVSYMEVAKPTPLRHLRTVDRHETIEIPPQKYKLVRQREYIADGFRIAAD